MGKRLAGQGNAQRAHMREIGLRQYTRQMDLREKDFFGRSFSRPPDFDPTLQCAELTVAKAARILPLQLGKQGLGVQARIDR